MYEAPSLMLVSRYKTAVRYSTCKRQGASLPGARSHKQVAGARPDLAAASGCMRCREEVRTVDERLETCISAANMQGASVVSFSFGCGQIGATAAEYG